MKKFFISCILLLSTFFTYGQTITSTIEFVVNTDSIIENESFNNFTNQVLPYVSKHREEVTYVLITGSASPEGNQDRNVELATERAKKLESFLEDMIPKERMISQIVKTPQADVKHYPKLRSATVEIHLVQRDTIYKKIVFENTIRDTVVILPPKEEHTLVFSLYNDLLEDMILLPNIGVDLRLGKNSIFIDAAYSKSPVFGKTNQLILWNTGFRTYGNKENKGLFIEAYGRAGYFDIEMIEKFGVFYGCGVGIGYKFGLLGPWKIYPLLRFGVDWFNFNTYYSEGGGINITFGRYVDANSNNQEEIINDRVIDKQFFTDCYKTTWFGPTFLGITIQRDFYLNKKLK